MESSEDAVLDLFRIGPTTTYGRVIALKVLSCNYFSQLISLLRMRASNQLVQVEKFLSLVLNTVRRWFNPRNPNFLLGFVLVAALALRRYRMGSIKAEINYRKKFWSNSMKTALTYDEWAHAATMLDKYNGRKQDSDLYDEDLVRAKLEELQHRRLEGGVEEIAFHLRTDLVRNLGNMCNPELHKGRLQTPRLIQEYINEVRYHLRAVVETDSEEFPEEEKLAFIHETRHAFGRTALLLSGGAALGAFHLGVVRTLIEHKLLPRVIAGASVGSIICSFCATRTWTELQGFFDDPMPPMAFFENMGSIVATAHRLFTRGAIHEIGLLQRKMRQLIGDLTFQEAYDLSGRVLGITVSSVRKHEPPRLLNYLTSPHVVIWSAVTASCAFPGLFEAQELMAKNRHGRLVPYHMPTQVGPEKEGAVNKRHWRDGSLDCDLPIKELKELFNVNHYIVSQANPHIAPLLRIKEAFRVFGGPTAAKLAHLAELEVKHRCNQALEMGFRLWGVPKLFAQPWEGDVTIVMPATFAQFAKIIANPTPSELRKAVMQGRRCTWARLSAIQANCGIELMLDECVSELNRRRKLARDREMDRQYDGSRSGRFTLGTKRIPSWNCMARESSWGSLEEDGTHELSAGPWAGSSYTHRRGRHPKTYHDGSDSDSGTDNHESVSQLWTKAGGPLMRTASAARLALLGLQGGLEDHGDGSEHGEGSRHGPGRGEDGGEDVETPRTALRRLSRAASSTHLDSRNSSWRARMWERVTSPISPSSPQPSGNADSSLHLDDQDESDAEDRSFGLAMRSGLRKSPRSSTDMLDALVSQSDRDLRHASQSLPGGPGLDAGTPEGDEDTVRGGQKLGCMLSGGICGARDRVRGGTAHSCSCSRLLEMRSESPDTIDSPGAASQGGADAASPQSGRLAAVHLQLPHSSSEPPLPRAILSETGGDSAASGRSLDSARWESPRPLGTPMICSPSQPLRSKKSDFASVGLREMFGGKLLDDQSLDTNRSDSGKVGVFGSFVSRANSQADSDHSSTSA